MKPRFLELKRVFFPTYKNGYWLLIVILPKQHRIGIFNSLTASEKPFFDFAHSFLQIILREKYKRNEWTEDSSRGSQQTNGKDCRVFVCINALVSANGEPPSAVIAKDVVYNVRRWMVSKLLNSKLP
jgi:Ulp1 family protease